MHPPVSRRSFLAASAGLALAASCGRGGRDGGNDIEVDDEPPAPSDVALVVASYVHVVGIEERVTLALVRDDGPERLDRPLDVSIVGPTGEPIARVTPALYADDISLPYLMLRTRFERPGTYEAQVTHRGRRLKAALTVEDPADVKMPVVGRPLVSTPTPTVADPRGVSPVCTRKPACPLHDVSLDAALAERRPIALLFSTPALCKSQLCGPVLENLLAHHGELRSRVRFLHAEIYTDTSGKTLAHAVQAFNLQSEPFLFLAGPNGVVREKLDNAFDRQEVGEALRRLAAS